MKKYLLLLLSSLLFLPAFSQIQRRAMTDGKKQLYYTDMADAEAQLMSYYKERVRQQSSGDNYLSAVPYRMFINLVTHDHRAFDYPFSNFMNISAKDSRTSRALRIVKSPDGKLKLYTWDDTGASISDYSGITTVRGNRVRSEVCLGSMDERRSESSSASLGAYAVHVVADQIGKRVYLIQSQSSCSATLKGQTIKAFRIQDDRLVPAKVFFKNGRMESRVDYLFSPHGQKGLNMIYRNGELKVPETARNAQKPWEGSVATGRLYTYRWNGTFFKFSDLPAASTPPAALGDNQRETAPVVSPHPRPLYDLNDAAAILLEADLGNLHIRVDKLQDNQVRYATWKQPKTSSMTPDIVIKGGEKEVLKLADGTVEMKYVFSHDGYYYAVSWTEDQGQVASPALHVIYNDKVIQVFK